jgi:hypothetical protein
VLNELKVFKLKDYINTLHRDVPQWYGWAKADGDREVYEHLIIHNDSITKPTEQECIDGVIALQTEYDSQAYARSRKQEYDKLPQFEMQFDDNRDGTTTWVDSINEIKERFPK